jgi:hypothetical protein
MVDTHKAEPTARNEEVNGGDDEAAAVEHSCRWLR